MLWNKNKILRSIMIQRESVLKPNELVEMRRQLNTTITSNKSYFKKYGLEGILELCSLYFILSFSLLSANNFLMLFSSYFSSFMVGPGKNYSLRIRGYQGNAG